MEEYECSFTATVAAAAILKNHVGVFNVIGINQQGTLRGLGVIPA